MVPLCWSDGGLFNYLLNWIGRLYAGIINHVSGYARRDWIRPVAVSRGEIVSRLCELVCGQGLGQTLARQKGFGKGEIWPNSSVVLAKETGKHGDT